MRALLQVVECVDSILGLAGACLRLSAHPLLLLAQGVFHLCQLRCHGIDAFLSATQIVVVVAFVGEYLLTVDFDYLVAHTVEKIAVVGHHQQCHA